jgi:hypothetical protein
MGTHSINYQLEFTGQACGRIAEGLRGQQQEECSSRFLFGGTQPISIVQSTPVLDSIGKLHIGTHADVFSGRAGTRYADSPARQSLSDKMSYRQGAETRIDELRRIKV